MCDTLVTSFSSSSSKLTSGLGNLRLTAVERRKTNSSSSSSSSTSAILANAIDILRNSDGFLNCALYARSATTIKLRYDLFHLSLFLFFFSLIRKNNWKESIDRCYIRTRAATMSVKLDSSTSSFSSYMSTSSDPLN